MEANLNENTCETKTNTRQSRPFSLSSDDSKTIKKGSIDDNRVRGFQANKYIFSISRNYSANKAKRSEKRQFSMTFVGYTQSSCCFGSVNVVNLQHPAYDIIDMKSLTQINSKACVLIFLFFTRSNHNARVLSLRRTATGFLSLQSCLSPRDERNKLHHFDNSCYTFYLFLGLLSLFLYSTGLKHVPAWTTRLPGSNGVNGRNGLPGGDGRDGTKGEKGVAGALGPRGVKGEAGQDGVKGEKGVGGTPGPLGVKGEAGRSCKDADHRNWKQCAWKSVDDRDIGLLRASL